MNVWFAKAAIAELLTRYAFLNDAGKWEELVNLYTEDGRMSRPTAPTEFIAGRTAILASFQARAPRVTRHVVANVIVTMDGDGQAHVSSQILLFTGAVEGGDPPRMAAGQPLVGSYHDRVTLTANGWRFVERRGSLDFRT